MIMHRDEGEIYPYIIAVCFWLAGILVLLYYLTYDVKRNRFKKFGECFPGQIIGADVFMEGRGEWTYCLLISFYDEGDLVRYTEGYKGNPNQKLKSCECKIYKMNGKYIEADLKGLDKGEKPHDLKIPVKMRFFRKNKKSGYV